MRCCLLWCSFLSFSSFHQPRAANLVITRRKILCMVSRCFFFFGPYSSFFLLSWIAPLLLTGIVVVRSSHFFFSLSLSFFFFVLLISKHEFTKPKTPCSRVIAICYSLLYSERTHYSARTPHLLFFINLVFSSFPRIPTEQLRSEYNRVLCSRLIFFFQ